MHSGTVIGFIDKSPYCSVYFVATERRSDVIGQTCDVVFSRKVFDLGHDIEYRFKKIGEEFVAYA